jgi:5-methylcytosine-specific restriction endonuclease McrA
MSKIKDEDVISAVNSTKTMSQAAAKLNIQFSTFKRHAQRLGCYHPNQGGLGTKKFVKERAPLQEILDGLHPSFQTYKLKLKLFKAKIKNEKCEQCGIIEWFGKKIPLELDHIDGNRTNHKLENLRILCPNCHSQTATYRAKNIKAH